MEKRQIQRACCHERCERHIPEIWKKPYRTVVWLVLAEWHTLCSWLYMRLSGATVESWMLGRRIVVHFKHSPLAYSYMLRRHRDATKMATARCFHTVELYVLHDAKQCGTSLDLRARSAYFAKYIVQNMLILQKCKSMRQLKLDARTFIGDTGSWWKVVG